MEQTSHGELYVYTKKRELAQNGSSISVLLHLDMNHLGPIDIHLSLTGKSVAAKFYLEEELSKQVTQISVGEREYHAWLLALEYEGLHTLLLLRVEQHPENKIK